MGKATPIWQAVLAERRALADDLDRLAAEQWRTPSLSEGWSVHDGLAHLVDTAIETRLVEAIVHGEDIRRPLGMAGEYPDGEGEGQVVTGRAIDLLMVVSGRATDADALSGPAASVLIDRGVMA